MVDLATSLSSIIHLAQDASAFVFPLGLGTELE